MRTRDQLTADTKPFADKVIKQLPPRNEDYVSWQHYAQRLLLAHGGHRYTVTSVTFGDGQWTVAVRVQFADDEWYDGVGMDSKADAAESQAYKRACAHAGIGLHLYGEYWLHTVLTQQEKPKKRKTARDYRDAAAQHILDLVGGDEDEAVAAWPLVLEAAGLEEVATKAAMEKLMRTANNMFGTTEGTNP